MRLYIVDWIIIVVVLIGIVNVVRGEDEFKWNENHIILIDELSDNYGTPRKIARCAAPRMAPLLDKIGCDRDIILCLTNKKIVNKVTDILLDCKREDRKR